MDSEDVTAHMAASATDTTDQLTVSATLQRVVARCVQVKSHCDMAGVSVITSDRVRSLAATGPAVTVIDELQSEIHEGPCFDRLCHDGIVVTDDVGGDPRWPHWGPIVSQQIGVNALMSYCLFTTHDGLGVLNLYSMRRGGFDREDLADGYLVAAQAAVALTGPRIRRQGQEGPGTTRGREPRRTGMKVRIARGIGGRWSRGV